MVNVLRMLREKKEEFEKKRNLNQLTRANIKTRKLEKKADFSKSMGERKARQDEANKVIMAEKSKDRERLRQKFSGVRALGEKLKSSRGSPPVKSQGAFSGSMGGGVFGSGVSGGIWTKPKPKQKPKIKKVVIYQ